MKRLCLAIISLCLASCATTDPDLGGDNLPFEVYVGNATVEGVAISEDGMVYATGTSRDPGWEGWVAKFRPDGERVRYTHLVGHGQGVAVDEDRVFVVGGTNSYDLPVKNAYQSSKGNNANGFILCLDWTLDLDKIKWATYVGGAGNHHAPDSPDGDSIKDCKVCGDLYYIASGQNCDAPASRFICGIAGQPYGRYYIKEQGYVMGWGGYPKWSNITLGRFSKTGEMLEIVNPCGTGPDTTDGAFDVSDAGVYYGGRTKSIDFVVTPGAYRTSPHTGGQAWFTGVAGRLRSDMTGIVWGSLIGVNAQNSVSACAARDDGALAVVGRSKIGSGYKALVAVFSPDGSRLEWQTYLCDGELYDCEWAEDALFVGGLSRGKSILARYSRTGTLEFSETRPGQCVNSLCVKGDVLLIGLADGDGGIVRKEFWR